MTIDKANLRALAEDANAVTTDVNITMAVGADPVEVKAVQDYLQVAMPQTILALLAEIDRVESELMHMAAGAESDREQRNQLKAENEALRKDAQRYRWLRDKQTFIWLIQDWFPGEAMLTNVDADIDAAMAKEASHG